MTGARTSASDSWNLPSTGGRSDTTSTSVPAASTASSSLTMKVSEKRGYIFST